MFSLNLEKSQLSKILSLCNQISPKKSDIDIFTYTKIVISNKKVQFIAINHQSYFEENITLTVENEQECEFLVKTDILTNIVNLFTDTFLIWEVDLEKHTILIIGNRTKYTVRINTENLTDFITPTLSQNNEIKIDLVAKDFIDFVKNSFVSVALPKNTYDTSFLNVCLAIDIKKQLLDIVSTDRLRVLKSVLKIEKLEYNKELEGELQSNKKKYLLLPKNLQLLLILIEGLEKITLEFLNEFLVVIGENNSLYLKYGEGNYPDYDNIIPQSFTCNFELATLEFLESLKKSYFLAKNNIINKSVTLNIYPNDKKMIITVQTDDGYSNESSADLINYEGQLDDWKQSFNSEYLLDYVNLLKSEFVVIEANPGKPIIISAKNNKDKQLYLLGGLK